MHYEEYKELRDINTLKANNAIFLKCRFYNCDFNDATFNKVKFIDCSFDSCDLREPTFVNCEVYGPIKITRSILPDYINPFINSVWSIFITDSNMTLGETYTKMELRLGKEQFEQIHQIKFNPVKREHHDNVIPFPNGNK